MLPRTRRTTDTPAETPAAVEPKRARTRAVATASLIAATLAAGILTHLSAADAAADPALYGFGSSSLLQSQDFHDVGVKLDEQQVQLYGGQALSACTGEETMYDLAGKEVVNVGARWTSRTNADQLLTETAGRTASAAETTTLTRRLITKVKHCQHEPKGHWHYGGTRTLKAGSGSATWMLSYDGDGIVSGGVAVIRDGNTFGILELTSPSGPAKKTVQQIVTEAIGRLE